MKDNFQDRFKEALDKFQNAQSEAYSEIYESDDDNASELYFEAIQRLEQRFTQSISQLFKDYIEAEIIGEDEALPEWGKLWKESRNDFRAKQREKLKALQQYKSNLLEGLSDE